MEILVKDEADAALDAPQADASQDATPAEPPAEPKEPSGDERGRR